MDDHAWPCLVKSARQKRRLVITDRDKQLIQLNKRHTELWYQRQNLPQVLLDKPYQRGWKRFFVLQEEVKHSLPDGFYENLLKKINTTEYHYDKSFKQKRLRKRCRFQPGKQTLKEMNPYQWNITDFTDQERACFTRVENYVTKCSYWDIKYVITEPWRYKLKVAPNIITHRNALDTDLEKEFAWIENHIKGKDLWPRINSLLHGKSWQRRFRRDEELKQINAIKKVPRNSSLEAYVEL